MNDGTIEPGTTSTLGSISAPDLLAILGGAAPGAPGGTGLVRSDIANRGSITVHGGSHGAGGGQLDISASLANAGSLDITGGLGSASIFASGGSGGTLTNAGVLGNTGRLLVGGGLGGGNATHSGVGGQGGALRNSGSFSNGSTLVIGGGHGGVGTASGGGAGGTLDNTGTLTNTGRIILDGGLGGRGNSASGGAGATLGDNGVMLNTGDIFVTGGSGGQARNGSAGAGSGGLLTVSGSLDNEGFINLQAGVLGAQNNHAHPSGGALSVTGTLTNAGAIVANSTGLDAAREGDQISVSGLFIDTGVLEMLTDRRHNPQGGGGTLAVEQGGTFLIQAGGSLESEGAIINHGLFAIRQGDLSTSGTIANSGIMHLGSGSRLINDGLFNNTGALRLAGAHIGGDGGFLSSGLITGTGTLATSSFTNDGTVSVSAGRLVLESASGTSGKGAFAVGAEGTLVLIGSIGNGQTVQLGAADARLQVSAQGAGVLVTLADTNAGTMDVLGGGAATLNAADTNLVVHLHTATDLTLSRMQFVAGVGSTGDDSITALASRQMLTGGLGTDTLTGAAATGDLFRDTAAGLNGDTIVNFAGTDAIDITDIAPGKGLALGYEQNGASGLLSVSDGGASTSITLAGSFTADMFTTTGDGRGGVLVQLAGASS